MIQRILANSCFILKTCFVRLKIWKVCFFVGRDAEVTTKEVKHRIQSDSGWENPLKGYVYSEILFSWLVFKKCVPIRHFLTTKMKKAEGFEADCKTKSTTLAFVSSWLASRLLLGLIMTRSSLFG